MLEKLCEMMTSDGAADCGALARCELEPVMEKEKAARLEEICPDWRAAVIAVVPYYVNKIGPANISRYAWGEDYHKVVPKVLEGARAEIEKKGYRAVAMADNSPVPEKKAAAMAGLGVIGMNTLLITPKYGSWVFIGEIVTDCPDFLDEIPTAMPVRRCENCGECVRACPSGALDGGVFNKDRCVSYISQKKGELTDDEKKIILDSGSVWGCDRCQAVCPHNKNPRETEIPGFRENLLLEMKKDDLNGLSNKMFIKKYGYHALTWRGKATLERNLDILDDEKPF